MRAYGLLFLISSFSKQHMVTSCFLQRYNFWIFTSEKSKKLTFASRLCKNFERGIGKEVSTLVFFF
jgi:hypothetical protein